MFRFVVRGWWVLVVFRVSAGLLLAAPGQQPHSVQFGVDTYLADYHPGTELGSSIKASPVDRTNYLDAVRDLGVATIREEFMSWSLIQPQQGGEFHYEVMDDIVHKASERGIPILGLAYFFPPWATVGEDRPWNYKDGQDGRYQLPLRKYESDFKQFVRKGVGRYCGCQPDSVRLKTPVREWLFMNEPEGYAGMNLDADEYAHWLRIFYEQVKSVDPGAKVVAPALAVPGIWRQGKLIGKFLDVLLSSKELKGPDYPYIDVVDFHPYPGFMGPPGPDLYGINISYNYVRDVLAAHNLNLPLWVTEIGDNSGDLTRQADLDVKYVIHAASVGVDRVYVFGLWDYGKALWGLLEDTPSGQIPVRKPSFIAYQTLLHKMTDDRGVEFLGPGRYRVLRAMENPIYVLWAQGEYSQIPSSLHGRIRVTDLQNHEQEIDAGSLKLSEHPVLVEMLE
jgi:hypothetical protein